MQNEAPGESDASAATRGAGARQADEVADLRRRLTDERLAEELRDALRLAAIASTAGAPVKHSRLLEMIVEAAAHVIGARAAALFLVDEAARQLVFEVALGEKAEDAKKFRVPLGHGVAGLVAVTGQPMAVSEAQTDPRHASDIAQSVGYVPESILCVPLFYEEKVIGVLELLDKKGQPSFTQTDMEALSLFAKQAAVAIEQSRIHGELVGLTTEALRSFAGIPEPVQRDVSDKIRTFAENLSADAGYKRALEMARLVGQIVRHGDAEARACAALLRGFAEYLTSRPRTTPEG